MKAVRIFEFGGPDKLRFDEFPMPEVGPRDVLVKVMATTVSRWDIKYRSGEVHGFARQMGAHGGHAGRRAFPMPMQLGRDVAGTVVESGAAAARFKSGDRVIGLPHPDNPTSIETIRGLGNLSTGVDLPGHTTFGGNAQYVAWPEDYWLPISDALTFDAAAAAMWACSTACHIVNGRLNVRINDRVLVTGASGGMGTATVQMARLAGATVIATSRSAAKKDALIAIGADHVIDVTTGDALAQIQALTQGQGVDKAVEFTGVESMMRLCIDAMRLGGTFCPVGGEASMLPLRVSDLVAKELNVHGVRASTRNDQRIVVDLLEQGKLRVPIHATLPLSRIAEAHQMMDDANLFGRIVLHPW